MERRKDENERVELVEEQVDDTATFYHSHKNDVSPLTPAAEQRLLRRNFWWLLPQTWWIAFLIHLDKSTLSSASTMGLLHDVPMSRNQFNSLFLIFYAGYLVALWPGAWLSQRVGHHRFIVGSLLLWAVLLGVHPIVRTASQMMAVRFLLGLTESQIVPSTAILHMAFFPPLYSVRVQLLWWAAGSLANVLLTMVAYQLIQDDNQGTLAGSLASWQWLHIICAVLTAMLCVPLLFLLPGSPVTARWLSIEDKVHTIALIRRSRAGITNSAFQWSQVRECFCDLKSWLFIFHLFFNELPNNTSQQVPLLIVGFGFTAAESALFNIVKPLWGFVMVMVCAALLHGTRLGSGYTCALSYIPCIIGGFIELSAPWTNKVALVVGTQIATFKPSYMLGLAWAGATTTGHTKKLCLMTSCVVAGAVANMISPEFWQSKYQPRYVLPWSFMTAFWLLSPAMCLTIRFYLRRENRRRMDGGVEQPVFIHGQEVVKEDLDQTDRQNPLFLYAL
ncbi:putative allantoate permease of the major facilitator superfamily [Aspergillus tanneri]|uniref:Major facilitator superfamily (MFS) profile domain-containing protein n=1 Tax=Aspergillus tanneri TaxID=1220188 RepID=A0A5M9MBW3_9EURO|nr:uncharacterized protein ATNIH1004_009526 [Aspergillus tanneri]KAA8642774.1 hypothetical protein ATNIH1004_009526 [Aspergillus tanneri]